MTVINAAIISPKYAENSQTTQYTSSSVKTIIDKFTATNISAAAVVFGINLVASGDTAADDNLILDARTIQPQETYSCPEVIGHTLEAGGFISTICDTASALTIRASGRKIS